jgi:hypothetical protein
MIFMKRKLSIVTLGLLVILLTACSTGAEPAQGPSPTTAIVVATSAPSTAAVAPGLPTNLPSAPTAGPPEAGKASVVGRVLSKQDGTPLAGTSVRLAEVTRQGSEAIYVLDGANSPGAVTAEDGSFVMANIVAREYVMVVGDPYSLYAIVTDETTRARVWNAAADQVLDVGEQRVELVPH